MRTYKTKKIIKGRLIESLKTGEGIRTCAKSSMGSGSHHTWLTGAEDNYEIHNFGQGQGWSDQSDEPFSSDLDEVVSRLWRQRASILEQDYC